MAALDPSGAAPSCELTMNMKTVQAANRKKVLQALQKARANPLGGLKATSLHRRTGLCLRTVQTHLRALRAEGIVRNHDGVWAVIHP